jgi:prolyl 4-hydroxylase
MRCGPGAFCDADDAARRSAAAEFEVLSKSPRIFYFPSFLTMAECVALKASLGPRLKESAVANSGNPKVNPDVRLSSNMFIDELDPENAEVVPLVQAIKARIERETKISPEHFEEFQVQRYTAPDGFYVSHYDSMLPDKNPRIATMIFYLSDVEEGGETVFPLVPVDGTVALRPSARTKNLHKMLDVGSARFQDACGADSPYLKVKPRQGAAVLFYTIKPDGTQDKLAVHGSCPVKRGVKWVAQQWVSTGWYHPNAAPSFVAGWHRRNNAAPGCTHAGIAQRVANTGAFTWSVTFDGEAQVVIGAFALVVSGRSVSVSIAGEDVASVSLAPRQRSPRHVIWVLENLDPGGPWTTRSWLFENVEVTGLEPPPRKILPDAVPRSLETAEFCVTGKANSVQIFAKDLDEERLKRLDLFAR